MVMTSSLIDTVKERADAERERTAHPAGFPDPAYPIVCPAAPCVAGYLTRGLLPGNVLALPVTTNRTDYGLTAITRAG